jgi:ribosome biogenesis protein Tsr3
LAPFDAESRQDEISKVLEVTEEVELYLKEMLFIVEHGSEKQAFLLFRKIDKYIHQADNELLYVCLILVNCSWQSENS